MPPLGKLGSSLRNLHIESGDLEFQFFSEELRTLLKAADGLETLSIKIRYFSLPYPLRIFDEMSGMRLNTLHLDGLELTFLDFSPFRQLSCLDLSGVKQPRDTWESVLKSGCRLRDLKSPETAEPAFFRYLASYSGLRSLHLTYTPNIDQPALRSAIDIFYEEVLPKHAGSLETLHITSSQSGAWSFGERFADFIGSSTKLTSLKIPVERFNIVCSRIWPLELNGTDLLHRTGFCAPSPL